VVEMANKKNQGKLTINEIRKMQFDYYISEINLYQNTFSQGLGIVAALALGIVMLPLEAWLKDFGQYAGQLVKGLLLIPVYIFLIILTVEMNKKIKKNDRLARKTYDKLLSENEYCNEDLHLEIDHFK
jgi:hypothetical protein